MTSFARILTGWTIAGRAGKLGEPGSFVFNSNAHEPGPQILLRKTYAPEGTRQGEAAPLDLARHKATANHIATKFSRHFVADEPPWALVGRLAGVFSATDGDLKAVTFALIAAPEAWTALLTKMRMPYEFLVADADHRPRSRGSGRAAQSIVDAWHAVLDTPRAERLSGGLGLAGRDEAAS